MILKGSGFVVTDIELMQRLFRTAGCLRRRRHHAGKGFFSVLDALAGSDGLSQQALSQQLEIRPQSLSEALVLLEEEGWIVRAPDPSDRRKTLVYLTEAGKIRRDELYRLKEVQAREFFAPLSEEEKEELYSLLCRLWENAREDEKGGDRNVVAET